MALNIKKPEIERLASEVAKPAKETKTFEVRNGRASKRKRIETLLRDRIWPSIPADVLGTSISKEDEEQILGYGANGV